MQMRETFILLLFFSRGNCSLLQMSLQTLPEASILIAVATVRGKLRNVICNLDNLLQKEKMQ